MSIERIPAVVHAPPTRPRGDDGRNRLAEKGETLRLAFTGAVGDDLLVADDRGFALRLAGLARQARDFVPGDVLLLRVLATAPRLELEFLGTSGGARTALVGGAPLAPAELAAMRLDQTVAQRISWLLPEATTLATNWYLRVRDAGRPPGSGAAPLLLAGPPGAVHEFAAAAVQGAMERWAVPVFAWGGLPAQLRFVPMDEEDVQGAPRRKGAIALRVELALPVFGPVAVQVIFGRDGMRLALTAEHDEALDALRNVLPEIGDALAAAGMTLAGSSLACGRTALAAPNRLTAVQAQQLAAIAAALSPGPFRAVAEVVVMLLSAALAAEVGPGGR